MKAGPELDALVAEKVMVWELRPRLEIYGVPDKGNVWCFCGQRYGGPVALHSEEGWSPSTDIATAWEVVENLAERGMVVDVRAWMPGLCRSVVFSGVERYDVEDTTAPHAICLAALKAVGYVSPTPESEQP